MRKSQKGPFLLAAKRMMREMQHLFNSGSVPWQAVGPFDLRPYITAMLRLCEERHIDNHPIDHLRQVARVLQALPGPIDITELNAAQESAVQYEQWLSSTFPEAFAEMRRQASQRARKHALN